MRGTLHLVAADDLPLMLAVFGALYIARSERRLTELGLPPDVAERSTGAAAEALAQEGPLTRYELAEQLRHSGVPVAERGQAAIAVVRRAALAGVLCEVGVRGREELYGRIDHGPLPDRDAALAELGRRYAAAHAPATAADLATWSGLPAADVRRAWAAAEDNPESRSEPGGVRLLPAFDEWLLGWADRDLVLEPAFKPAVLVGGIIRPVVIVDGRVAGTWRLDRSKWRVEVEPFATLPRAALDEEIAAVLEFSRPADSS
jgi:hypothetical protein